MEKIIILENKILSHFCKLALAILIAIHGNDKKFITYKDFQYILLYVTDLFQYIFYINFLIDSLNDNEELKNLPKPNLWTTRRRNLYTTQNISH